MVELSFSHRRRFCGEFGSGADCKGLGAREELRQDAAEAQRCCAPTRNGWANRFCVRVVTTSLAGGGNFWLGAKLKSELPAIFASNRLDDQRGVFRRQARHVELELRVAIAAGPG